MRSWTLLAHGAPEKVLALRDRPTPEPKAHEVLIRCEGFGLNYADVMAVKGLYREAPPVPSVLGYEVVGRIEATGLDVPKDHIGKRVVAMTRFCGYAEYAVTDHRAISVVPDEMPLGEAAALATQGCTAWYAAKVLCPLFKGQRVLIHSAAGGVGHLLVQLALNAGATVYGIGSGREKMDYLRSLGVHHPIDRSQGDHAEQVRKTLNGARLDVVFNAVGGSSFKKDMALLGSGGRIVLYGGAERGGLGAFGTLRFVWRMGLVVPIFLMMKSRSILGINMLRIAEHHPDVIAECLRGMVRAQADGLIKPRVHAEYPADGLPAALRALEGGRTVGKVVLRW
ncbi:MAG TPA: zinc-binding dehydrogenase [Flavobacteriales bacterium]|nr:zinc-binding dehydrogenase [Flavobacteriales bacterium]